jgi:hypothetical protein
VLAWLPAVVDRPPRRIFRLLTSLVPHHAGETFDSR